MERGRPPLVYVRVTGDCMAPTVPAGRVVGVDRTREPRDGDLVVARRGDELLVKMLRGAGRLRWLVATADGHMPILLAPPVELVGVVTVIVQEL